ncbi:MAG TPA: hypothetical protein VM686_36655, partial [Polyangiaceae bacterium]|nr:hypothetical protein [Polyangiaceae bacterium]
MLTAWLIGRAPKHGKQLAGVALASWLAALVVLAFGEAPAGFPPTLMLLPTFVLVAYSLAGGGAGSVAFLAAIGVLAAFKLTHPALGPRDFALFVNVGIALTLTQAFGFTFWLTFRRLQRSLERRTSLISERIEQRSRLSRSFLASFDAALAGMATHLARLEPQSLQALRAGHQRMT